MKASSIHMPTPARKASMMTRCSSCMWRSSLGNIIFKVLNKIAFGKDYKPNTIKYIKYRYEIKEEERV
jgi:hypothetical protein